MKKGSILLIKGIFHLTKSKQDLMIKIQFLRNKLFSMTLLSKMKEKNNNKTAPSNNFKIM